MVQIDELDGGLTSENREEPRALLPQKSIQDYMFNNKNNIFMNESFVLKSSPSQLEKSPSAKTQLQKKPSNRGTLFK